MTTLTTNGVRHRKHTHRRAGRAGASPVPPSFLSGGWRGGGGLGGRQAGHHLPRQNWEAEVISQRKIGQVLVGNGSVGSKRSHQPPFHWQMTTLTTNGVRHRKHTHRRAGRAGASPRPSFLPVWGLEGRRWAGRAAGGHHLPRQNWEAEVISQRKIGQVLVGNGSVGSKRSHQPEGS